MAKNKKKARWPKGLTSPERIQDYLGALRFNFSNGRYLSPDEVIALRKADCLEGALVAALALEKLGLEPLLLDLKVSTMKDYDHVVAPFRRGKYWGAISKTNHMVLRYREPIYKSIRELVMSYFHEYFLSDGRKTLRSYSRPLNLRRLGKNWHEVDPSRIAELLDKSPHTAILNKKQIKELRKAEPIEIRAGKIVEWR